MYLQSQEFDPIEEAITIAEFPKIVSEKIRDKLVHRSISISMSRQDTDKEVMDEIRRILEAHNTGPRTYVFFESGLVFKEEAKYLVGRILFF